MFVPKNVGDRVILRQIYEDVSIQLFRFKVGQVYLLSDECLMFFCFVFAPYTHSYISIFFYFFLDLDIQTSHNLSTVYEKFVPKIHQPWVAFVQHELWMCSTETVSGLDIMVFSLPPSPTIHISVYVLISFGQSRLTFSCSDLAYELWTIQHKHICVIAWIHTCVNHYHVS